MNKTYHVGVAGAGTCSGEIYQLARNVGYRIGKRGWTLICGGLGGVMEAAARGCSEAGGITVGILPGLGKQTANPFIRIPIPTGLGELRNGLVVRASDVLIAVSGGYGTLSEIALALKVGKPVVGLGTWKAVDEILHCRDCEEAIATTARLLDRR